MFFTVFWKNSCCLYVFLDIIDIKSAVVYITTAKFDYLSLR